MSRTGQENRQYSTEERLEAVGLAISIGANRAADQLGIPRRTVSHWLGRADTEPAVIASRQMIADRLWEAVETGVEQVLIGLQDPTARLSDKAKALEVVATQHALLTGGVTSRSVALVEDPTSDAMGTMFNLMSADERATWAAWMERVVAGDAAATGEFASAMGVVLGLGDGRGPA